jgi:MFS family permease
MRTLDTIRVMSYGAVPSSDRGDEDAEKTAAEAAAPSQPRTSHGNSNVTEDEGKKTEKLCLVGNNESSGQGIGHNGAAWFLNDAPLSANILTPELMLMWVVSFGVWGTTTLITNNSSQIYQALDYDGYRETTNAVYVSMYGVASALGRVAVGAMQPVLLARRRHIATLFPVAPLINVLALPLFLISPAQGLIVPFFLSGLATGCTWGSTVLIIKSLFHHRSCGKHYNVLYTAGMLTPIVMNIALFGPIYDHHSHEQGLDATHSCKGIDCVLIPMLVAFGLNVIALASATTFYRRVCAAGGVICRPYRHDR